MALYMVEQRNSNRSCVANNAGVTHPAQAYSGRAQAASRVLRLALGVHEPG